MFLALRVHTTPTLTTSKGLLRVGPMHAATKPEAADCAGVSCLPSPSCRRAAGAAGVQRALSATETHGVRDPLPCTANSCAVQLLAHCCWVLRCCAA